MYESSGGTGRKDSKLVLNRPEEPAVYDSEKLVLLELSGGTGSIYLIQQNIFIYIRLYSRSNRQISSNPALSKSTSKRDAAGLTSYPQTIYYTRRHILCRVYMVTNFNCLIELYQQNSLVSFIQSPSN